MNLHPVRFTAIATLTAMLLTGTATALADGGHHSRKHGHDRHGGNYTYNTYYPGGGRHRRHNSDDDEKLLYGLLVGGLFGYVIGNNQAPATIQQPYYAPAPAPAPAPQYQYQPGGPASTCLQEREYQMKVTVGGRQVDAYGTACLQPDGSWSRGPARLVSR
ncbi:MAG TPA: hypothetical protein ENJ80_13415 [Gammaproteobacteria bacterium]|nr:hypothetical protein [Gammaproteobacteria bacterium]